MKLNWQDNHELRYLKLKEVNEMLDNPAYQSVFGLLKARQRELMQFRDKMTVEKEKRDIEAARKRGTLIE